MTTDQKNTVLNRLGNELPAANFYFFLESPDTDNEHFHIQVRKGTVYP